MDEILTREIDDLVGVAERLSRDASRANSHLGADRVEELSAVSARGILNLQSFKAEKKYLKS